MAHFNKHVFGHTITATEHIDISQVDELPEDVEEPDLIARLKSFSVSNPEPEPDVSTGMSQLMFCIGEYDIDKRYSCYDKDDEDIIQDSEPPLSSQYTDDYTVQLLQSCLHRIDVYSHIGPQAGRSSSLASSELESGEYKEPECKYKSHGFIVYLFASRSAFATSVF